MPARLLKGIFSFAVFFISFSLFFLFSTIKVSAGVLFQDDFNDGDADGWVVPRNMQWSNSSQPCLDGSTPATWRVSGGKYGISINGPGCVTETTPNDANWNEDWNDYVVIAHGNHLEHFINGVKMSEVYDAQSDQAATSGVIALQVHAGPPMKVQFKGLRIRESK